jgi:hypothetical protein
VPVEQSLKGFADSGHADLVVTVSFCILLVNTIIGHADLNDPVTSCISLVDRTC